MKIKFGAIVTDGRNKIGGHVASKNKAGNYLKTKSSPANPNTAFQSAVRSNFGSLAQSWRGLTQEQRNSWISGAPGFPYTDIFGDTKQLSGFGLYMQLNSNLNSVGAVLLTNCPSPATVTSVLLSSATYDSPITLEILFAPTPVPAGHSIVLSATPNLSTGRAYSKSAIRLFKHLPATTASPFEAGPDYASRFGDIAADSNIFIGMHSVLLATGQVSPMVVVSAQSA